MLRSMSLGHPFFIFLLILLSFAPGHVVASSITLNSLEIYKTHEWVHYKATVYFQCKGETKTILPDVKKDHLAYTFNGQESWQPLTYISSHKCKRCGFYEKSFLPHHGVFDEWELCPSDFSPSDGIYIHMKPKDLNASFSCPTCVKSVKSSSGTHNTPPPNSKRSGINITIITLISLAASAIILIGLFGAYKYWQKRKRQEEHGKFIQLFEEQDDFEDELSLGDMDL